MFGAACRLRSSRFILVLYNFRFESCWPALRLGVQGVILVCSPATAQATSRELELLYNYFVSQPKLSAKQCVVFYNCTGESDDMESLNLCMFACFLLLLGGCFVILRNILLFINCFLQPQHSLKSLKSL